MNNVIEPTSQELLLGRLWMAVKLTALIAVSALAGIGAVAVWLGYENYTSQLGSMLLMAGLVGAGVGLAFFGPDVITVKIRRRATVLAGD